jgi:peptide/nickel transport system substrate-binding protein
MPPRKKVALALRATACLLALPMLARWAVAPAAAKDDLVIGVAQFPSSLHPDIDAETIRSYVNGFTIRPITAFDPAWKNSCLLCSELPTIQNGLAKFEDTPDGGKGMAVTLKLKPDLKWGDGVPVTTKDLLFTWKLALDPASGFSNGHPWERASKIDIVDDHTAVLHLKGVNVSYNQWDQLLPEHIEGPVVAAAKQPGDYIKETKFNRAPTTAGLYDGPYIISQYQSGSQIVLDPNPYWSGTKPGFKHIVIKLIENTAALQANLLSGDVDMVAGEGIGLTIDQVIGLQKQSPDKFTYIFKPSLTYEHIDLQKDNPILADINVRHALLYAMDRKLLVDKLFAGYQPVATTWVNPLDPDYDPKVATYPYDLAKAKSLLAAAGWKPGSDGICRNAKGDRLSVEFSTTSGNRLRELTQQVLQSQAKQACVELTIKNEPPRTLFGETLKKRTYTGLVMYAWSSNVDESPRRTLGSDNIPTAKNNYGGANYIAFDNKQMDADIAKAESELDPEKQKAIWADMQVIYADQLPALPLFYRAEPHVVPHWLKGYTPTGTGDMSPLWSENWTSG